MTSFVPTSVAADLRFCHRLRFAHRHRTPLTYLWLILSSRGLWQLIVHRVLFALHARRRQAGDRHPGWLTLAYLMTPVEVLAKIFTKCEFLNTTQLDAGVYLSERGHIILGARRIGKGSVVHHNVTIGVDIATGGLPEIQKNVWIGPDCIIFGGIIVGEGSTLLPGTVLTKSVPPYCVVQGNPARLVRRDFPNSKLRMTRDIKTAVAMARITG